MWKRSILYIHSLVWATILESITGIYFHQNFFMMILCCLSRVVNFIHIDYKYKCKDLEALKLTKTTLKLKNMGGGEGFGDCAGALRIYLYM